MAVNTDPKLQNQVIYSVFVRNHTPEGTFRALIPDLPAARQAVSAVNRTLPAFKRIGEVLLRETEFEKTATRKIKRYQAEK